MLYSTKYTQYFQIKFNKSSDLREIMYVKKIKLYLILTQASKLDPHNQNTLEDKK